MFPRARRSVERDSSPRRNGGGWPRRGRRQGKVRGPGYHPGGGLLYIGRVAIGTAGPATGRSVVFLLDAASGLERRLLTRWIDEQGPPGANGHQAIPIPSSRRARRRRLDGRLEACLAAESDPLLAPLRVAWLPAEEAEGPGHRLSKLLVLGDPRDP